MTEKLVMVSLFSALITFVLFLCGNTIFDQGRDAGRCEGRCYPAVSHLIKGECSCASLEGRWTPVTGWVP